MAFTPKHKNSRRVRAIAIERQRPKGWPLLALALFFALIVILSTPARGEDPLDSQLQETLDRCKSDFKNAFKESFQAKPVWEKFEGNCPTNHSPTPVVAAEVVNYKFVPTRQLKAKLRDMKSDHRDLDDPHFEPNEGVCETSYRVADWALESMQKQREDLCRQTMQKINTMSSCYAGQKIKKCEEELAKIRRAIDADDTTVRKMIAHFKSLLTIQGDSISQTKTAYDQDIAELRRSSFGTPRVIAGRARVHTNEEYKTLLMKNPATARMALRGGGLQTADDYGSIVIEQVHARQAINTLAKDLEGYASAQAKFRADFLGTVVKYAPPDTDSNLMQYAGLAGPAASMVSGSGAAAAAVPLATAAAGGAAAIASAGKSSIGGGYGGMGDGASRAPQIAETGTSTPGNGARPTAPVAGGGPLILNQDDAAPKIPKEEKVKSAGGDTFIPAALLNASGSSTGGSRAPASGPADSRPTTAGGGGSEDLLHSFNDAIKPIPAPTKKKDDGLGDMGSIFGQMSKMFNLDPPPPPGGEAPPPPDMAADNGAPAGGEFSDGGYAGGYAGGAGSSGDEYAVTGAESASATEPEMVQFGSIGTPLFQRVHQRHRTCIEKGLIVQEFGRLPQ